MNAEQQAIATVLAQYVAAAKRTEDAAMAALYTDEGDWKIARYSFPKTLPGQ